MPERVTASTHYAYRVVSLRLAVARALAFRSLFALTHAVTPPHTSPLYRIAPMSLHASRAVSRPRAPLGSLGSQVSVSRACSGHVVAHDAASGAGVTTLQSPPSPPLHSPPLPSPPLPSPPPPSSPPPSPPPPSPPPPSRPQPRGRPRRRHPRHRRHRRRHPCCRRSRCRRPRRLRPCRLRPRHCRHRRCRHRCHRPRSLRPRRLRPRVALATALAPTPATSLATALAASALAAAAPHRRGRARAPTARAAVPQRPGRAPARPRGRRRGAAQPRTLLERARAPLAPRRALHGGACAPRRRALAVRTVRCSMD